MPLIHNKRSYFQEVLIDELRNLPDEQRLSAVAELVGHMDPETRSQSIDVAYALNHPQASEFCATLLKDHDWRVRSTVCESVYISGLAISPDALLQLVANDEHELVRFYAALALVKMASDKEIPAMLRLSDSVSGTNHEGVPVRDVLLKAIDQARSRKHDKP